MLPEQVVSSLSNADPFTAGIIIIGLIIVAALELHYRAKLIRRIFDDLNILVKTLLVGPISIFAIFSSQGSTTPITFVISLCAILIFSYLGVGKIQEQLE